MAAPPPVAFRVMFPRIRTIRAVMLGAVFALGTLGVAGSVRAQTNGQRIDELESALGEASAEEIAHLKAYQAAQAARAAAAARVASLDAQALQAGEEQVAAETELAQASGRLLAIEKGMRIAQAEIDRTAEGARLAAQRMYVQQAVATAQPLEYAVSLDDTNAALTASHYLDLVQRQQRAALDQRRRAQDELRMQQSRFKGQAEEARAARDRAVAKFQALEKIRGELALARNEATQAEQAEATTLAEVRTRKAQYERELAQARAESEALASQLGNGSGGTRPGRLLWPVNGPISSSFGPRPHPIYGVVKYHEGIDIAVGTGVPIRAAASGTVVSAGWRGGYGNATVIDHGGGMATLYGHQSRLGAQAGQRVSAGEVIGYVGSTGNSTGPHLHFEVRTNGRPVDPLGYL